MTANILCSTVYIHCCESRKSLEGDCRMDRVISRRSTPEIVLLRKNLNSVNKVANWIIVDILKYLY